MDTDTSCILTINVGSSSLKFDLFRRGSLERVIGGTAITPGEAVDTIVDWLQNQASAYHISAIGHRVVHGGPHYFEPTVVSQTVLEDLRKLTIFDPEHLPTEIRLVEQLQTKFPDIPQVVCFDTAFHHDLPPVAQWLAIPRRYRDQGLRRYGFHGLSCQFILQELDKPADRTIIAHLGSGASLTAVREGKSVDTTMSLTPAGGVPMSTRSGDLDPGVLSYLARTEQLTPEQFDHLVNFESGLLGVSGQTADMKTLLEHESGDGAAAEAVALFCYQIRKAIGSLMTALGGLDTLVFTGGMGENAPKIRARVCQGLEFLGIILDDDHNQEATAVISASDSPVTVRIIHTDEAQIIAQNTQSVLNA